MPFLLQRLPCFISISSKVLLCDQTKSIWRHEQIVASH